MTERATGENAMLASSIKASSILRLYLLKNVTISTEGTLANQMKQVSRIIVIRVYLDRMHAGANCYVFK